MSEERVPYGKVYTTFGGADAVCYLNQQLVGEISNIQYEESFEGGPHDIRPVKGYIDVCVFDRYIIRDILRNSPYGNHGLAEFDIKFCSEFGQRMDMKFKDFKFTKRQGGISVDSIMMTERYFFECMDIELKEPAQTPTETCDSNGCEGESLQEDQFNIVDSSDNKLFAIDATGEIIVHGNLVISENGVLSKTPTEELLEQLTQEAEEELLP